jgi:hypothetical protein
MKFIAQAGKMVEAKEAAGKSGFLMEKFNNFSDWAIQKETDLVVSPFLDFLQDGVYNSWQWFLVALPDIMGYAAIATAVLIILGAMLKGDNVIKYLAVYAGMFIFALCLLGGV